MWLMQFLLLVACCCSACLATVTPMWNLNQVGDYFNGIFRSIVGPFLGLGNATRTS
ncbi:uncharacterized protein LOC111518355 [Drosophila willistoni]|uniref:uncharacterized protein LOC111518355 n=1 Tax=Drosophila willistoni TaxID=7260 RepID=UPI001F07BFED|nr:uncharacterized protein LOC111518355 [Drosophila willistoni]